MGIKARLHAVRTTLRKHNNFRKVRRDLGAVISSDPLFAGLDVGRCFAPRPCPTPSHVDFQRIVASYNAAKRTQRTLSSAWQVGNEWLPIYRTHLGAVMSALERGDAAAVRQIYEQFMRHSCSMGLHGLPLDMEKAYFKGRITPIDEAVYRHDAVYRHAHWRKLTQGRFPSADLQMPEFGDPYGIIVDGRFVRTGAEYFHYYATQIATLAANTPGRKHIAELGGGYGGLGYFLCRDLPGMTYLDFDLPENMALTAYFLLAAFPEKKVLLYGEAPLDAASLDAFDIAVLPNFEMRSLPTRTIDVVFNSYSLAEMSVETIRAYVPELARACRGHILHVNHTRHSTSLAGDDFGVPAAEFELVSKQPALWNLGRNVDMDEYEFLYRRR
jgi:putative sugar O-methyltransferase